MAIRVSSQDLGYESGQLSLYPEVLDDKEQLYIASNNSVTNLKQSLSYNGKYLIVEDSNNFPSTGILRVGPPPGKPGAAEMVYYGNKSSGVFKDLIRGFAGSRQNVWPIGSHVSNAVFAEHHNAVKDAIINIENNLGTVVSPSRGSLNEILKRQEARFLSPKAIFRASIVKGSPPLTVRFQNFSTGPIVRSLWDFGDGSTSIEKSPTHVYETEGIFTVQLNVITSLGAQGYCTKSNYITVDKEEKQAFFYVYPIEGTSDTTAGWNESTPELNSGTVFEFVDQTDGDIIKRWWILDGDAREYGNMENGDPWPTSQTIFKEDPNEHTLRVVYKNKGEYNPSLLVLLSNQTLKKAFINPNNVKGLGISIS